MVSWGGGGGEESNVDAKKKQHSGQKFAPITCGRRLKFRQCPINMFWTKAPDSVANCN